MLMRCESCGKFFGAANEKDTICSSCLEGEKTGLKHIKDPREQRFVVARNLVYENPDISPEALIKEMKDMNIDITLKEIMSYVKEGRLTLKNADPDDHNLCEDCGKRILSGRKCPSCTKKFEETLTSARVTLVKEVQEEETEKKRKSGMYSQD